MLEHGAVTRRRGPVTVQGTARASSTTLRLFIPTKVYIIKFICYKSDLGTLWGPREAWPIYCWCCRAESSAWRPGSFPGGAFEQVPIQTRSPRCTIPTDPRFPLTGGSTPVHGLGKSRRAVLSTSLHAENGGDAILHRAHTSPCPGSSIALCQGQRRVVGAEPGASQSSQRRF